MEVEPQTAQDEQPQTEKSILQTPLHEGRGSREQDTWYTPLTHVTPVSKALAIVLFVALPFVGFWLGVGYGDDVQHSNDNLSTERDDRNTSMPIKLLTRETVKYFCDVYVTCREVVNVWSNGVMQIVSNDETTTTMVDTDLLMSLQSSIEQDVIRESVCEKYDDNDPWSIYEVKYTIHGRTSDIVVPGNCANMLLPIEDILERMLSVAIAPPQAVGDTQSVNNRQQAEIVHDEVIVTDGTRSYTSNVFGFRFTYPTVVPVPKYSKDGVQQGFHTKTRDVIVEEVSNGVLVKGLTELHFAGLRVEQHATTSTTLADMYAVCTSDEYTYEHDLIVIDGVPGFWCKSREMGKHYAVIITDKFMYTFKNFGLWERHGLSDSFKLIQE